MLTNKALSKVVLDPTLWSEVAFRHPGTSAVNFVRRTRVCHIAIKSDDVDQVTWFLERLRGVDSVQSLSAFMGKARPVTQFWFAQSVHGLCMLRDVSLRFETPEIEAVMEFPEAVFPHLHTLVIEESGKMYERAITVLFRSCSMPSLQRLTLCVNTSDVLCGWDFPDSITKFSYLSDHETYDIHRDMGIVSPLNGRAFDTLELDIHIDSDVREILHDLAESKVKDLHLRFHDDAYVGCLSADIIRMTTFESDLTLHFPRVCRGRRVIVCSDGGEVVIAGVATLAEFRTCDLTVQGCSLVIEL